MATHPPAARRGRPPKDPADRKVNVGSRIDPQLARRLQRFARDRFRGFLAAALEHLIREGTPELGED